MSDEMKRRRDRPADGASGSGDGREGEDIPAKGRDGDEWERMIAAFRRSAPESAGAPPWLEDRVMAEIETLPEEGPVRRALAWLVRPAPVRIPPLAGLAAAAAVVTLLVFLPRPGVEPTLPVGQGNGAVSPVAGNGGEGAVVYVQFVLEAPGADSVAVAGDFSEWQPSFALDDVDGDGVWTGRVPVKPGVHAYMFLIDGTRWQTDPRAERYADDGFGNRNAVLAVAAGV